MGSGKPMELKPDLRDAIYQVNELSRDPADSRLPWSHGSAAKEQSHEHCPSRHRQT
jgi:hypothetical protein